jgi:hypothetical protein
MGGRTGRSPCGLQASYGIRGEPVERYAHARTKPVSNGPQTSKWGKKNFSNGAPKPLTHSRLSLLHDAQIEHAHVLPILIELSIARHISLALAPLVVMEPNSTVRWSPPSSAPLPPSPASPPVKVEWLRVG